MNSTWLARFANEPALVAPHLRDRFESNLAALGAQLQGELVNAKGEGDEFWTELGPYSSKRLRPYIVRDGILLVPVKGVLLNGFPYQLFDLATGYEYIWKAFDRGIEDPDVDGIAFVVDSPGGMVAGNFDLVDHIFEHRGEKPLRAFAAESAYSAAYSIASAADRIIVSRTGGVGSIGVVTSHLDVSKAMDDIGFKVTFIHAGKHKVDGNPYEALPEDVKARIQARVDELYGVFVDTVARNRNLDAVAVRATEALTYTATQAIEIKLADAVGALDAALADFAADITNPDAGDEDMTATNQALTVASVKADHPEVANALIAEGTAAADAKTKPAVDDAIATERARVTSLDGLLAKMGSSPKAVEIVNAAKADGTSPEATAMKLIDAGAVAGAGVIGSLQEDNASAAGAAPSATDPTAGGGDKKVPQTPDGWKAEWEGSEALQGLYPTATHYVRLKEFETRQQKKGA